MDILVYLVLVITHFACFLAGLKISDKYHDEKQQEADYQSRLAVARQRAGDFSVLIPKQEIKQMPIGQPFLDKLKENGRATQQINTTKPIA